MAYKIIKEGEDREAILINGFDKGIAPDPYSGMNRMFQVDFSVPDEVSVGFKITANATSGGTLGVPVADSTRLFTYGTPGVPTGSPQSFAMLDTGGQVWESTSIAGTWAFLSSSNSTSGSSLNDGICYWLGYLFKTRGANLDYWDGSTWHTAWKTTLTAGVKHYMYVASDNVLYITNGNWVASLTAGTPTAFDPTSAPTYTFNINKLQVPVTDICLSFAEVGIGSPSGRSTLLIGGTNNAIYPWDKTSVSFGEPIYVAESYIGLMVSVNQNAFIFPGNQQGRGRVYITNGSQADLYFKMPDHIFNEQDPYYVWGDAIFHRNNLIFGCFVTKNSGAGVLLFAEVFAIDLDTQVFRSISSIPANSTAKANATCLISTLNLSSAGFGFILGWDDNGSAPGIGYSGTTAGIGTSVITSDLMNVGTFYDKRTNSQVEFKLRSALQSGESFTVTPVVDGVAVTALQFNPTPTVGSLSGVAPVNFQGAQWLQFQIASTGNSATSGVRLHELRVR